jgi:heat shock protein HslJ
VSASHITRRIGAMGFIAVLALAACGQDQAGSLAGTTWRLTDAAGTGATDEAVAALAFADDGTVAGTTGCNSLTGPYTVEGDSITIGPLATTRALCTSQPLQDQETALLAGLEAASSWSIEGDVLVLADEGGTAVATFERYEPSLTGTWTVTGYNNGSGGVTSLVAGTEIALAFGEDGTVSGNSGCNDYSGTYESEGDSLSFGAIAVTGRECLAEGVMEQETQFLAALSAAETWLVFGSALELRDAGGSIQVTARPAG